MGLEPVRLDRMASIQLRLLGMGRKRRLLDQLRAVGMGPLSLRSLDVCCASWLDLAARLRLLARVGLLGVGTVMGRLGPVGLLQLLPWLLRLAERPVLQPEDLRAVRLPRKHLRELG